MDSLVASRAWPARVANTQLKDLNRELDQIKNDVADLERWSDRFHGAIEQGFVINVMFLKRFCAVNTIVILTGPKSTNHIGRTDRY